MAPYYWQLAKVEGAFRIMRQSLELRLLHHRLPERIRAHAFVRWLARPLVRVAATSTEVRWELLRDDVDAIHRARFAREMEPCQ